MLREPARRQCQERNAAGGRWHDTGYMFTNRHGNRAPWIPHPPLGRPGGRDRAPPVRLHDLRPGAATLAHLAGTDLKTIWDQLGHSSIVLTAAQYKAAEPPPGWCLDAARNERSKIATAARRIRLAHANLRTHRLSRRRQIRDHRSSPAVSRTPKAITGHGYRSATTVHTELDERLSPQLRVARPKRFELPTF